MTRVTGWNASVSAGCLVKAPARSVGEIKQRADVRPAISAGAERFQEFAHTESIGAAVLLAATAAALFWSNSPWSDSYRALWEETYLGFDLGFLAIRENLRHWVNDGLMVIFFFVVGLEVKHELVHGELSSLKKAGFPAAAALGGMVTPAAIYLAWNAGGEGSSGWGVPIATDIAFALGVFALAGDRVPVQARIFLLALAAVDDVGAILVIAVFYSQKFSLGAFLVALAGVAAIWGIRKIGMRDVKWYIAGGLFVWLAVFESGVHATLAGVGLGLMTPSRALYGLAKYERKLGELLEKFREARRENRRYRAHVTLGRIEALTEETEPPLRRRLRATHPWSAFFVLPVFALANAGVEITGDGLREAVSGAIFPGVALGLIAGKTLGIVSFAYLAVKAGLASMPDEVGWGHVAAVGMVAGIGFTVSLFIIDLALTDSGIQQQAKLGVLAASAAAGAGGLIWLRAMGGRAEGAP